MIQNNDCEFVLTCKVSYFQMLVPILVSQGSGLQLDFPAQCCNWWKLWGGGDMLIGVTSTLQCYMV